MKTANSRTDDGQTYLEQDIQCPACGQLIRQVPCSQCGATRSLPPDPDGQNADRAEWAHRAVLAFENATGTDREDALADLLADLMHWCNVYGQDFDRELCQARSHYQAETEPEGRTMYRTKKENGTPSAAASSLCDRLKAYCAWLDTDDEVEGSEAVQQITAFYESIKWEEDRQPTPPQVVIVIEEITTQPKTATATESSKGPIQVFNDRELATVLHALRHYQERRYGTAGGCVESDESGLLCDHFEEAKPLGRVEIDALCERLNLAPDAATVKEHFPHDVCPGCGKPSVPLEGVPDQTGRGCGQCGREWVEDLSRPATTEPDHEDHEECSEKDCTERVYPEDPYFATPCGTYCTEHMREHVKECGVCKNHFD